MARSTARKRALNTLYEADEKGQEILSLLAERIDHPGAQTPLPEYAIEIIRGVEEHRRTIDSALNQFSQLWKVRRMAVVDRNILRIATWEIKYNPEVPSKVAIDEALSLAKTLSDAESPSFIHGVLSAIDDHKDEIEEIVIPVAEPESPESEGPEQEHTEQAPSDPDVRDGADDEGERDEHNSAPVAELKSEEDRVSDDGAGIDSEAGEQAETSADSTDVAIEERSDTEE
ncbi:transcription antitermination factor NusB [Bifidobacterium psychraerophilum]|jgi:N utilization substance protein B|uniref:transcription antitermination factor NusB n=1 Tax=Bifidobacterium psychraerophilum TaxID=218140 RepID=UPI0023F3D166|nr:transcription antitermination factor NusB [Bifidobacterium psychraerophilum]MCI1805133.1 transcription antitermination factor NusB [Bifidobacterium psychraerophilum]MCI2175647.1 transcription antitermination factor NusB [Bifidobacterium psychraerophilum]MCI2181653.1 transcription antitermination factor NusB [Bifidobacterium psychraerophilum]